MAKRKALILYGSITGNTEKVGRAFAEVCTEYGFEADCVKIDPKRDWMEQPVFLEDYDLVCLGSPIIAGLPYKEVSMLMGLQGTKSLYRNRETLEMFRKMRESGSPPGPGGHSLIRQGTGIPGVVCPDVGTGAPGAKGEQKKTIYGVVFCTYGGSGVGPEECYGSLEVLVELMRVNGIRTVGKFACPGRELRHTSVDGLAVKFKMNIDETQALLQRYQDDPNAAEFTAMAPEQLATLKKAAAIKDEDSFGVGEATMVDNDPMGCGKPGSVLWHYDFQNRPSQRDLAKAKIFLSEVVEDYFLTFSGDPRPPYSVYTCIS